tara:strand:+ start:35 stop:328 length:294 start_codon:yes stop_codon:yes gene_type:complete
MTKPSKKVKDSYLNLRKGSEARKKATKAEKEKRKERRKKTKEWLKEGRLKRKERREITKEFIKTGRRSSDSSMGRNIGKQPENYQDQVKRKFGGGKI